MFRKSVVILFFIILFLGQMPGLIWQINYGFPFRIHILDIFVLLISAYTVVNLRYNKYKIPKVIIPLLEFLVVGLVGTWIIPLVFKFDIDIQNILYALRLISYGLFIVYFYNENISTTFIERSALLSITLLSLLGFLQYLLSPDMRWLAGIGWDDHYFRMVSTMLDPAFLGIILVIGIIIAIKNKSILAISLITVSIGLTYSRASWLVLLIALFIFLIKRFRVSQTIICLCILLFTILLLPNPGGEGVNLYRTNSIEQKYENSQQALVLIDKSPLFGWGTGNICNAKEYLNMKLSVNSCRGLDNSFLFVVASTGLIGTFLFLRFIYNLSRLKLDLWIVVMLFAVVTHSLFTNTLFYPFVMGIIAIFLGKQIKLKENS